MKLKLLFLLLTLTFVSTQNYAQVSKVKKIVLDAGHGGSDPGAVGKISNEKTLTLEIVKRLGKIINDSLKGVQVIYTRTTDIYPTLKERHALANQAAADLFVSVHINATAGRMERVVTGHKYVGKGKARKKVPIYKTIHHKETKATGTETLVLGNIRNNQKTGALTEYGEKIIDEPGLLNENDPETAIIIAQYTAAFLDKSVSLATKIQKQFENQGRRNMGVKQQSLEVLAGTAMPAVLVECGFINNPEEEVYMNSEEGQQEIAMAIFNGIKQYKIELERNR